MIREAAVADADAIAALADQLGYQTDAERVRAMLGETTAVVADDGRSTIIGWMQLERRALIATGPIAEVCALVVDRDARGRGVGVALLDWAEAWAAEHTLGMVRIRCNTVRVETHMFYQRRGYRELKTQTVFAKDVPPRRR